MLETHVTSEASGARKVAVRLAILAFALSAIALVASPGPSLHSEEAEGLQFEVRCAETGGSAGQMSCALVISGLPSPLQDQVSVALFTAYGTDDTPADPATSDTVVAAEAPDLSPQTPTSVVRSLPIAPPAPSPRTPQVPKQPPKSL